MPRALYVVSRAMPSVAIAFGAVACGQASTPPPAPAPAPAPQAAAAAPVAPLARARLYAEGVPLAVLPISVGIETAGGIRSLMLSSGTPLPASHAEIFSTAADDQPSVEIHVVQGERADITADVDVGKVQLIGLPPAKRGIPKIQVTFAVDRDGVLSIAAEDLATHVPREVRIEGAGFGGRPLDRETIAKLSADGLAGRAADLSLVAIADKQARLMNLISAGHAMVTSASDLKSPGLRTRFTHALASADTVLAAGSASEASLDAALADLGSASQAVAAELWARAPPR